MTVYFTFQEMDVDTRTRSLQTGIAPQEYRKLVTTKPSHQAPIIRPRAMPSWRLALRHHCFLKIIKSSKTLDSHFWFWIKSLKMMTGCVVWMRLEIFEIPTNFCAWLVASNRVFHTSGSNLRPVVSLTSNAIRIESYLNKRIEMYFLLSFSSLMTYRIVH